MGFHILHTIFPATMRAAVCIQLTAQVLRPQLGTADTSTAGHGKGSNYSDVAYQCLNRLLEEL